MRRGVASLWTSANPILADGEEGFETDTGRMKLGNGVTAWNSLAYFFPGSLDQLTVDVSGGTITLNLGNLKERTFVGLAAIGTIKTWAFSNAAVAIMIHSLKFVMSSLNIQTFPANVHMANISADWNDAAHQWTPPATGTYEAVLSHEVIADTWLMKINGPF